MKNSTPTMIFENEISIKSMLKKVKEQSSNILNTTGASALGNYSCFALFNIPSLKVAR